MRPVGAVPAVVVGGRDGGGSRKGWEREGARLVLILMGVRGRAGLGAGLPLRTLIAALLLLVPPSYPNPNHLSPPRYLHPLANSPNNDNQLTSDIFSRFHIPDLVNIPFADPCRTTRRKQHHPHSRTKLCPRTQIVNHRIIHPCALPERSYMTPSPTSPPLPHSLRACFPLHQCITPSPPPR